MKVHVFRSFDELTENYHELCRRAAASSFYYTEPWFRNLADTASDAGDELRLYGVEDEDPGATARCLLVTRRPARKGWLSPRSLVGFTNYYSTLYGATLDPSPEHHKPALGALVKAIAAESPRWDIVHLDALDHDAPTYQLLADALQGAGFLVQRYFHFGNWYQTIENASYEAYHDGLSVSHQSLLRKSAKKVDRAGAHEFVLTTDERGIEKAIADYEKVYAASWKEPEPYPHYAPGLIRACARAGVLRLGLIYLDGEPAAAQIWIVCGGSATIYKVAHDERFKKYSVGTVLTTSLMKHVIEIDHVTDIDFGHGDDAYKKTWLPLRRERWGIVAFNPRTFRGAIEAARNIGGHKVKDLFSGGA